MDKTNSVKQKGARRYENSWFGSTAMVLGVLHVVFGVMGMIVNAVGIHFHANLHNYGHGIWSGTVFLVTGVICILAGILRSPPSVIIMLVASVASAVISIPMMGITAAGMDHDRREGYNYWVKDPYTGVDYLDGKNDVRKAAHALLLTISLVELANSVACVLICVFLIRLGKVTEQEVYVSAQQQAIIIQNQTSVQVNRNVPSATPSVTYTSPYTQPPPYPPTPNPPTAKEVEINMSDGETAFTPLHSIHDTSHHSHNTSASSFAPLHMIQPDPNASYYSQQSGPPSRYASYSSEPYGRHKSSSSKYR